MRTCPTCGAQVSEFARICPQCGAPLQPLAFMQNNNNPEGKSKIAAALLAFFLGCFAIHYFYLGKTKAGLIYIGLEIITCGLFNILSIVSFIGLLVCSDEHFENEWLNPEKTFPVW
ncbi:MAG: NINE protein [Muribaculaceae bacterium]|nr:NINE protein [Muribaculaceae bacterium]